MRKALSPAPRLAYGGRGLNKKHRQVSDGRAVIIMYRGLPVQVFVQAKGREGAYSRGLPRLHRSLSYTLGHARVVSQYVGELVAPQKLRMDKRVLTVRMYALLRVLDAGTREMGVRVSRAIGTIQVECI